MKFNELKINLKKEILPCYLINGGESFLTTKALELIEKNINLAFSDINKNVFFDDTNRTAKDIVACCEELPFCDNYRLVVVHDYLNKKNEQEKKVFSKYLQNPNNTTCLVFFSTKKSEFFSSLEKEKNVEIIDCEKLSMDNINLIVSAYIKGKSLNISINAQKKLMDYCNYSITKIITEIDKFSSIFDRNKEITENDIETFVVKDLEYAIFDLTNAISQKDKDKSFLLVNDMLKNKEQPISIISMIENHFRRLFFVARSDCSNFELAQMLSVKEFAISKYKEQCKNFSIKKLKDIFEMCVETEFKCKNGKMEGKTALVFLLSSIFS